MRLRRSTPSIDRATAEELVSREAGPRRADANTDAGVRGVESVLAAAAAPARASELTGEQAALAAFRAAGLGAPAPWTGPSRVPSVARLAVVQALAVVGVAVSGVALAAATGLAPGPYPWQPDAPVSSTSNAPPRPVVPSSAPIVSRQPRPPQPPIITVHPSTDGPIAEQERGGAPSATVGGPITPPDAAGPAAPSTPAPPRPSTPAPPKASTPHPLPPQTVAPQTFAPRPLVLRAPAAPGAAPDPSIPNPPALSPAPAVAQPSAAGSAPARDPSESGRAG
jgi:hypothetical protein